MSPSQAASREQLTSPTGGYSDSAYSSKAEGVKLPVDSISTTSMANGTASNGTKPKAQVAGPKLAPAWKVAVPHIAGLNVAVPKTAMPKVTATKVAVPNGAVPNWKGPEPDAGVTSSNGDPFKKEASATDDLTELSGGASTFKPKPAPISFLNHDSMADDQPLIVSSTPTPTTTQGKGKGKGKAAQEPIGTRGASFSPSRQTFFSTDMGPDVPFQGGHYIMIGGVTKEEFATTYKMLVDQFDWASKLRGQFVPSQKDGSKCLDLFLCFDDLSDAEAAFGDIELVNPNWSIQSRYISQPEFATGSHEAQRVGSQEGTAFYDGQILFVVAYEGLSTEYAADGILPKIQDLAATYGAVLSFAEVKSEHSMFQFRVEYYSISVAKKIFKTVTKASPVTFDNWVVFSRELQSAACRNSMQNGVGVIDTPQKPQSSDQVYTSPTGRTAWYINESGNTVPVEAPVTLPKVSPRMTELPTIPEYRASAPDTRTPAHFAVDYPPRSESWSGGQRPDHATPARVHRLKPSDTDSNNTVDVERLRKGVEVRTTLMLRNIPNMMDVHRLKKILDSTSFGRYDFSYLRVDYKTGCNMGYAFVNFCYPQDVIRFVEAQIGQVWAADIDGHARKGPRAAEVWWAAIQGLDCLIEKFRNSAVMNECKEYTPKLWWTEASAETRAAIGQEAPFPPPNNATKHSRSMASAGQVGLYTPGNRRRANGDHRRRSQYDRGTPAQMQEDAFFQQMSPMPSGSGYGNYALAGTPVRMAPQPIPSPFAYGTMSAMNNAYTNPYMIQAQGYGYGNGYSTGYGNGYGAVGDPYGGGFGAGVGSPATQFRTSPNVIPGRGPPGPPQLAPRRPNLPYIGEHINGVPINPTPRSTNLPAVAEVDEGAAQGNDPRSHARYY